MRHPNRSTRPSTQAFALVIALSLMSFVLLLILSITTLVQVESRSSAAQTNLMHARANALLGLNIALGELQKHAGPDQRISARAEILDTDASTEDIDNVDQPHWTGIWETGSEHLDVGNNPQRAISFGSLTPDAAQKASAAQWLVSQDPDATATVDPIAGPTGDSVIVAKEIGQAATDVTVPLVLTDSANSSGAYGYWVADEGIKAKLNLDDPDFGANGLTRGAQQLRSWSPIANAMQTMLPLASGTDDFRETPSAEIQKILSPEGVALLSTIDGSSLDLPAIRPDFTLYSEGVLADVRNGGLKKDLTAAFEDESNFHSFAQTYGKGNSMLFRTRVDSYSPSTGTSNFPPDQAEQAVLRPDGMLWDSLFYYYNTYKAITPAPVTTAVTAQGIGDPDSSLPYSVSTRAYYTNFEDGNGDTSDIRIADLLPQVIVYRVDIALSSYFDGTNWKLRVHYFPQLVLHNPYSVRIAFPDFTFKRQMNIIGHTMNVEVGSTSLSDIRLNQAASGGRLVLQTAIGETDVLEPGETRVYGLDTEVDAGTMQAAITFSDLVSTLGMSPDWSQYCDLPGYAGTTDRNEVVRVTLNGTPDNRGNVTEYFVGPNTVSFPKGGGSNRRLQPEGNQAASQTTGTWTDLPISSLTSPRYIGGVYVRRKGMIPGGSLSGSSFDYTAEAPPLFIGNCSRSYTHFYPGADKVKEVYSVDFGTLYQTGVNELQIQPALNGTSWETSWGSRSVGIDAPNDRVVLADLPSQPMVSLGQFTHTLPYFYVNDSRNYNQLTHSQMAIGGSYAHALLPTTETAKFAHNGGSAKFLIDDSFLANQALFDTFFLSTVPPAGSVPTGTTWPTNWMDFTAANTSSTLSDATLPLLNQRIRPRTDHTVAMADLRGTETAAANLILDGAFNINSTSVNAWKAFLGTYQNHALEIYETSGSPTTRTVSAAADNALISRFWSATTSSTPNSAWSGLVELDDGQLTELAQAIVEQVKLRGPFLSMADFLNRRQGDDGPLTRSGALQAAIDDTSINDSIRGLGQAIDISNPYNRASGVNVDTMLSDANHYGFVNSHGDSLTTATGMPGDLMQQDLVQNYSAAMTARSDTFVIRCYGEHRDSVTNTVQGKVWGEAVVQRLPDYFDPADAPETAVDDLTSTDNQRFGRRFVLRSFRWLNENEI